MTRVGHMPTSPPCSGNRSRPAELPAGRAWATPGRLVTFGACRTLAAAAVPQREEHPARLVGRRLAVQARLLEQGEVTRQRRADRRQRQPEFRARLPVPPELVAGDPPE